MSIPGVIWLNSTLPASSIEVGFIQPAKPDQNACIERFSRTYCEELLSAYLFESTGEVREITDALLERYKEIRPPDALGSLISGNLCLMPYWHRGMWHRLDALRLRSDRFYY